MYPLYKDLKTRLGPPKWYDQNGTPRYDDFTPKEAAQIYSEWVALMTIECQACGKAFQCANAVAYWDLKIRQPYGREPKANDAPNMVPWVAGWGDAPWHDADGDECGFDSQCSGTTMSTDWTSLRVWFRDDKGQDDGWSEISDPEDYLQSPTSAHALETGQAEQNGCEKE